jgi:enamine deaminase RidA (YjgF/YER057c/UK114 family)
MATSDAQFFSPPALHQPFGYSHAVSARPGRVVWTAGQVAMRPDGTTLPADDWEAQTRLAMENVGHALAAAGAGWPDVVKLTFFVVDVSEFATIRAVRDEFLDAERRPASTLVRVAGLLMPELLVEIEAIACPPNIA